MTALLQTETVQERPEMHEKPCLFDHLGLVALPTAINCARMFTRYTLDKWNVPAIVMADALTIVGELVALAVQDTGVANDVTWSEMVQLNSVVVRMLGFRRHVVIEVLDAATEAGSVPDKPTEEEPQGLDLVDVVARRWASTASPRGRLTWAEIAVYDHTESGLQIRRGHASSWRAPVPNEHNTTPELLRRVRDGLKST
jgi:hypothetical protein